MTEQQGQGQDTSEQKQDKESQRRPHQEEQTVPYHRFTQLNETNKQLQKELDEIRKAQESADEERAKKQGEYQKLAEKYKTQAEREKQARQQLELDVQRDKRMRVFTMAAQGVIRPEAIEDAFYMLSSDEFQNIDEADEAAMRRLAESLTERKPYLSDGPVGAGSGGFTNRPILGSDLSPDGSANRKPAGKKPLFQQKRAPAWKR